MANIKADEISKILREQIANYEQTVAVEEVGSVISVGDGIARVHGLEKVMFGEMIAFPHNVFGIALNLEEDQVGAVLLGEYNEIKEGDTVKRTNTIMSVPAGEALIGRVVNDLHLLRDRAEALDHRAGCQGPDGCRRDGVHHHRGFFRRGAGLSAVHCAVCGMRHGRIFSRQQETCRHVLRRSFQTRSGLPRNLTFVASSTRPRSFPWRRLLSSLALAGTRREVE